MARACSSALAAVLELYCQAGLQDNMTPWGLCFNTLVTFGVLAFCTLRFHILYIFHKYNIKIKLHLHLDLDAIKSVFGGLRTTKENLPKGSANNKDTDQPAHPCSLISTFVIRFFERIISKLATSEI